MKARRLAIAMALLLGCVSSTALAQSETKAAVAEALYRQARDLMAAGNYQEACPKFAESQRLDPATGTLLNLAACHEKQGRLATAWLEYSDALVAARRDGREDRVVYARSRAAELEPKLSRLTLLLAPDADEPDLTLELDGASIGRAVLGAPTPVDPGPHVVRASAPGKQAFERTIEIGPIADQQSMTIPKLAPLPPQPVAQPAAVHAAPAAATLPSSAVSRDALPRPVPAQVYVTGGITLALLASAGVTGMVYRNKKEDFDAVAKQPDKAELAEQRRRSALRLGYVNLGMWIGAAAGASLTTYLFVTRPAAGDRAQLSPWAAPGSAGLSLQGAF